MHGIGEYRYANGNIYKGSWANGNINGMGLFWFASGDLYQGNYKDNKRDGLQIIHIKANGDTADVEYQDDLAEGLNA
jgi:hypothetical protein